VAAILIANDVERRYVLHECQHGVQWGCSAVDAAGVLVATVEEIWERTTIVAAVMMDIKGAFRQ
jgi:hypothetical protein